MPTDAEYDAEAELLLPYFDEAIARFEISREHEVHVPMNVQDFCQDQVERWMRNVMLYGSGFDPVKMAISIGGVCFSAGVQWGRDGKPDLLPCDCVDFDHDN